jgi:chorismate mutase/prephenate dehydrogenase
MSNPAAPEVMEIFAKTAQQMQNLVADKDHQAFAKMFREVRDYFGAFTDQALEQSSFLIDRLVERT